MYAPDACLPTTRNPGAAPPAQRNAKKQQETAPATCARSNVVGLSLPVLAQMAGFPPLCQARYRHRLASKRISTLLEMEEPSAKDWSPQHSPGAQGAHSNHERLKFPVGSSKAARRIAQAWNRGFPGHGCEIYGEASEAAFPALAGLPG